MSKIFFEKFFGDSRPVVADPAFHGAFLTQFPCPDDNLAARRVLDCVGDQVLKDPPQQTRVCIGDQVVGYLVDQLSAGGSCHRMEIVNEGLNQRPQIKLAPLQFDPDFRLQIGIFLDHLADQRFEVLHAATQDLEHLGCFRPAALRRQCQLQDSPGHGNGIQWRSQIVRDKGKIFLAPPLHLQRALCGIGLQCHADRMVENPVDNVERLPLQVQTVAVGEIVDTAAQDVVLRNDFFDIKRVLETLKSVSGRADFQVRF